ncbi:hypothetical protein [Thetidibacter halocola]|uniref:Polysaccharide pyruvyl transferase domain-containing protein n=1 Tax=Thetidibacter halocola TaxID=2827239 RepID=A0A8J7WAZ5_9RHOB|nr:hypothetical protein [Thetidibacter halocola]MBS0124207.1 hypothetical protein [Thetidibacter halocola]
MTRTVFMHRRRHRNVGDMACSPGHYVDLGPHEFADFADDCPPCDLLVMGGGQVFQDCVSAAIATVESVRHRVAWGVGISARDRRGYAFDILEGGCALVSTRNHGIDRIEWVPCASALSPLFDAVSAPRHEVVLFRHARKSADLALDPAIPTRSNDEGDMAGAIAFLASGATVVTNSYHGTYWALCLGRRVLSLPFSDKFRHFPDNPPEAAPQDWPSRIGTAEARPSLLETARARNHAFHQKVRNLL